MAEALRGLNVEEYLPELGLIADATLRQGVAAVWREIAAEMAWDSFEEVPKNTRTEPDASLLLHIRSVTRMSLALADIAQEFQGRAYDRDMLVAAGLLHDVSKFVESEPLDGAVPGPNGIRPGRKSRLGALIQHGVYGAHKALAQGLPLELAHLIVSHTHQSNTRGTTWEAAALFYADMADTDASLADRPGPMFVQRFRL